jgi:hypothetical protein
MLQSQRISKLCLSLLVDPHTEVRTAAYRTLIGILMSASPARFAALRAKHQKRFLKLSLTAVPKTAGGLKVSQSGAFLLVALNTHINHLCFFYLQAPGSEDTNLVGASSAMAQRHGGVLGLSALGMLFCSFLSV